MVGAVRKSLEAEASARERVLERVAAGVAVNNEFPCSLGIVRIHSENRPEYNEDRQKGHQGIFPETADQRQP